MGDTIQESVGCPSVPADALGNLYGVPLWSDWNPQLSNSGYAVVVVRHNSKLHDE